MPHIKLAELIFKDDFELYRFQDVGTRECYRAKRRCDKVTGEITLERSIETNSSTMVIYHPKKTDVVKLSEHYIDIAEEIPLDHAVKCNQASGAEDDLTSKGPMPGERW